MFESLSDRLGKIFDGITGRGALSEADVDAALREVRRALPEKPTGSHLSGHLLFGELAQRTGNPKYLALAKAAADLGFDAQGMPLEAMPAHLEMSDAVFMGCPILAQTGKLTGDKKYIDMCQRHFEFMRKLVLREDGLYRHSPLDEAAWGRGNGFPALGLALCLTYLPKSHPAQRQFRDAPLAAESAMLQDRNAVANQLDLLQMVAVQEDRLAGLFQPHQKRSHLRSPHRVDAVGGFVKNKELGIVQQRLCQPEPLLHAFGVLPHAHVAPAGQPHKRQHLVAPKTPRSLQSRN